MSGPAATIPIVAVTAPAGRPWPIVAVRRAVCPLRLCRPPSTGRRRADPGGPTAIDATDAQIVRAAGCPTRGPDSSSGPVSGLCWAAEPSDRLGEVQRDNLGLGRVWPECLLEHPQSLRAESLGGQEKSLVGVQRGQVPVSDGHLEVLRTVEISSAASAQ